MSPNEQGDWRSGRHSPVLLVIEVFHELASLVS